GETTMSCTASCMWRPAHALPPKPLVPQTGACTNAQAGASNPASSIAARIASTDTCAGSKRTVALPCSSDTCASSTPASAFSTPVTLLTQPPQLIPSTLIVTSFMHDS